MNAAQLARLRHQPEALDRLIAGLTDVQLRQQPQPGKWSMFEQITHLGRYQQVFAGRLHRIATEDVPRFERYVADTDGGFADWLMWSPEQVLAQAARDRTALLRQLTTYPAKAEQRTGVHPLFGRMDMTGWTEFFLLHEAHHLFAIMRLAACFRQPTG